VGGAHRVTCGETVRRGRAVDDRKINTGGGGGGLLFLREK